MTPDATVVPHIAVWRFKDAPKHLRDLSMHGGDEDWLAFIPSHYGYDPCIGWMDEGGPFGCCSVSTHKVAGGTVRIGAHA